MLNLDELRRVKTIVCHGGERPCPDGTASAILLRDALGSAEPPRVLFVQYGPELEALVPEPGVLFCDIAPIPERAPAFAEAGAFVLDHHVTARAVVESFGARGIFGDEPGVSGAVLAHRAVWQPLRSRWTSIGGCAAARSLARLAGVRDTWQTDSPAWQAANEQAAALAFFPWSMWPEAPFSRPQGQDDFEAMIAFGRVLYAKHKIDAERHASRLARFVVEAGGVVLVVGIVPTLETSDVAEAARSAVDLLVGFGYQHERGHAPRLVLSLRAHPGVFDCAAFCKANGGGGHTSAAGLSFEVGTDDPNPYAAIRSMLHVWLEHGRASVGSS